MARTTLAAALSMLALALVSSHTSPVARSRPLARLAHPSTVRAARMSADDGRPQPVGRVRPFIIGIGGGSASGKTTVVETIMAKIGAEGRVVSISQDCFYKGLSAEDRANVADYNFDHPAAMDFDEQVELLRALQQGATDVRVPQYDFCTHARLHPSLDTPVHAPDIVIFEGILALHDPRLRDMFDLSIYVDTDADLRLMRRIQRDIESRGRTLGSVVEQYSRFVKPSHDQFIEPCRKMADIVVPFNRRNLVAIELICDHIDLLRARCTKLAEDFHDLASARSAGLSQPAAPTLHAPPAVPVNGRVQPTVSANGRPAHPLM